MAEAAQKVFVLGDGFVSPVHVLQGAGHPEAAVIIQGRQVEVAQTIVRAAWLFELALAKRPLELEVLLSGRLVLDRVQRREFRIGEVAAIFAYQHRDRARRLRRGNLESGRRLGGRLSGGRNVEVEVDLLAAGPAGSGRPLSNPIWLCRSWLFFALNTPWSDGSSHLLRRMPPCQKPPVPLNGTPVSQGSQTAPERRQVAGNNRDPQFGFQPGQHVDGAQVGTADEHSVGILPPDAPGESISLLRRHLPDAECIDDAHCRRHSGPRSLHLPGISSPAR